MTTSLAERTAIADIVRRRLAPVDRRLDPWSWLVAAVVTAIAAIIRLVHLGRPGHIVFDETYYAPQGWSLLQFGVEWSVPEGGANPVDGAPQFGEAPAYVVHPPLGKWMIAAGEWIFGYTPFGWRFAAAMVGIASILMITRIGRRLFGSTVLGATAGLLMALDGMHVVNSRIALLDIFLLFFVVAAFGALVLDRDARRRRWLDAVTRGLDRPGFSWRDAPWWRYAAAVLLGAAVAVKWSAVFFILAFLVLVVVWEIQARRSAGVPVWRGGLAEAGSLAAGAVIIPVVYLASWTGWLTSDHGYLRHWRADNGMSEPPVFGALANLVHYHAEALRFHVPLSSPHPWESSPWQWLLLGRPVAIHWSTEGSCGADSCASQVLMLGTPLLWWSFLPALALLVWFGIARRDWRALAILMGAAAGIVPWLLFPDRVMFFFYALPSQPFLVLAVVYVLGALIGPARAGPELERVFGFDRRTVAVVVAGAYVMLVALNFAYFYPIFTGQLIPYEAWQSRMWLSRWI